MVTARDIDKFTREASLLDAKQLVLLNEIDAEVLKHKQEWCEGAPEYICNRQHELERLRKALTQIHVIGIL
jgi:hypothetical protein